MSLMELNTKPMDVVGEDMKAFRADLLKSRVPQNFHDLEKLMTIPKGIVRKALSKDERPENEGAELFDVEEVMEEEESDTDSKPDESDSTDQSDNGQSASTENEPTEVEASNFRTLNEKNHKGGS